MTNPGSSNLSGYSYALPVPWMYISTTWKIAHCSYQLSQRGENMLKKIHHHLSSASNLVKHVHRGQNIARCLSAAFLSIFCLSSNAWAQHEAEVIHWWVSGSERAALEVVTKTFETRGNTWIDTAVESSYYAKTAAITRISNPNPPTAVQWHTGVSLAEMYNEGLFRDLTDLAEEEQWLKVLPTAIRDGISVDGKFVAVPVTLHSSNWLWANKKILDEVGVAVPTNWQEFLDAAKKITATGYIPLALGGQAWQERALFLPVVLGSGGKELYLDAIVNHQPEALSGQQMINAFTLFGKLREFIDSESPDRSWPDTAKLIIEGKAAFQFMGDWAKGEFIQAGMTPGKEFLCAPSPGSNNSLLLVSDAFAMVNTSDVKIRESQDELARIMMDKEVQRAMNLKKGSIPPRTDFSLDGFDSCAQLASSIASREDGTYPGFSMANTGIVGSAMMSVISSFWNSPDLAPAEAAKMLEEAVKNAKL